MNVITITEENGTTVVKISNKDEIEFRAEELALYIKGEKAYQIGQAVKVKLTEVRLDTRSIVGNLI